MQYCVRNWWRLISESNYIRWAIASVTPSTLLCTERRVTAEHLSLLLPVRRRQRWAAVTCHIRPRPTLPGHTLLLQVVEHVNHITQTSWSLLHFGCCEDTRCRHMLVRGNSEINEVKSHCYTATHILLLNVPTSHNTVTYIHVHTLPNSSLVLLFTQCLTYKRSIQFLHWGGSLLF